MGEESISDITCRNINSGFKMWIILSFLLLPTVHSEFDVSTQTNVEVSNQAILVTKQLGLNGQSDNLYTGINKKCITPRGDLGKCTELTSCHLFYSYRRYLSNNATDPTVKKYFKMSYCGKRYSMMLICCGPEDEEKYEKLHVFDECGKLNDSANSLVNVNPIQNGQVTSTHFPWMVAIQYQTASRVPVFKCQGFLINKQFVLTAAHCLTVPIHAVVLGVSNLTHYEEQKSYVKAQVVNIRFHRDYVRDIDDIGLIQIMPMKYTEKIRWICLPQKATPLPDWYTIRGWGDNGKMIRVFTEVLQSKIPSAEPKKCRQAYRQNLEWSKIICAGGQSKIDSCEGDSGGALMNKTDDFDWIAFGIVSYGTRDCSIGNAGVYTRIQYYLEWLDKTMIEMLEIKR